MGSKLDQNNVQGPQPQRKHKATRDRGQPYEWGRGLPSNNKIGTEWLIWVSPLRRQSQKRGWETLYGHIPVEIPSICRRELLLPRAETVVY